MSALPALAVLVKFGAALRRAGLAVSVDQLQRLVRALEWLDPNAHNELYFASRAVLVGRREDWPVFERVFAQFWSAPALGRNRAKSPAKMPLAPRHSAQPPQQALASLLAQQAKPTDPEVDIRDRQATASRDEILRRKDFANLTEEELRNLLRLAQRWNFEFSTRVSRRLVPHSSRGLLDMRRLSAKAAKRGGIPLQLPRRVRRIKPRPVVLLVDISGSMELYARVLLQFFHSLGQRLPRIESFVFATRLSCVTEALKLKNVDQALDEVSRTVTDFSSGTRIGECLQSFNNQRGGRIQGRGSVVMIVSDGCDTGPPLTLSREMRTLKNRCHRLIWLNPRLSQPNFAPRVRGLGAALPHVDDFMTCHNMQSLEQLAEHLSNLPRQRGRQPGLLGRATGVPIGGKEQ